MVLCSGLWEKNQVETPVFQCKSLSYEAAQLILESRILNSPIYNSTLRFKKLE